MGFICNKIFKKHIMFGFEISRTVLDELSKK